MDAAPETGGFDASLTSRRRGAIHLERVLLPARSQGRLTARELRALASASARDLDALADALAARTGRPTRLAPSCRAGLVTALRALGVRRGAEVIVSAYHHPPTVERIRRAGFVPVPVDLRRGSTSLDPAAARAAIGARTEAIVATHAFGRPADLPALAALARRSGLALVEDAAQALGAQVAAGSDAAVVSFGPTKPLACWGGGAILGLRSDARAERVADAVPSLRLLRGAVFELASGRLRATLGRSGLDRLAERWETDPVGARRDRPWHDAPIEPVCARLVRLRLADLDARSAARRAAHEAAHRALPGSWPDAPGGIGFGLLIEVEDARRVGRALRRLGVDAGWGALRNVAGPDAPEAARREAGLLRLAPDLESARRAARWLGGSLARELSGAPGVGETCLPTGTG